LNMAGRIAATEPDGQGVANAISHEVESYYTDGDKAGHGKAMGMASVLNGGKTAPTIATPLGKMGALVAASGTASSAPVQTDAQTLPIKSGLGNEVDALVALSPSLQNDLDALKQQGWIVIYGRAGGGSFANRHENLERMLPAKSIVIDSDLQGRAEQLTQTLAHEVGHATYDYVPDLSTLNNYILNTYGDEGMAVMNEMRVRQEILTASGTDIGISGGNNNKYKFYYDRLDDLKSGKIDLEATRNAIGAVYVQGGTTSTTRESYEKYHGDWYINKYLPSLERHPDQKHTGGDK